MSPTRGFLLLLLTSISACGKSPATADAAFSDGGSDGATRAADAALVADAAPDDAAVAAPADGPTGDLFGLCPASLVQSGTACFVDDSPCTYTSGAVTDYCFCAGPQKLWCCESPSRPSGLCPALAPADGASCCDWNPTTRIVLCNYPCENGHTTTCMCSSSDFLAHCTTTACVADGGL